MARIFHCGFEYGRPLDRGDLVAGGPDNGTTDGSLWRGWIDTWGVITRRAGVSSVYRMYVGETTSGAGAARLGRDLEANLKEHFGRIKFETRARAGTGYQEILALNDGNGDKVAAIRVQRPAGEDFVNMRLYLGNTSVAQATECFAVNTEVRIEWRLLVDETSGVFTLKLNGGDILSYAGNTKGANMESIRTVFLGGYTVENRGYYDDVAINDTVDDGSGNNTWVGPGSIRLLRPKAVGNYTNFAPSDGVSQNWEMVRERPYGSASYVISDTPENIDTYKVEQLEADLGIEVESEGFEIKAVQTLLVAMWAEGLQKAQRVLRSGAVDNLGNEITLVNAYVRHRDEIFSVSPFTSSKWTVEELDDLEIGVKHKDVS